VQEDTVISKREGLIYEVLIPAIWNSGIAPVALLLVSLFPYAFHRLWWELTLPLAAVISIYRWNKRIRTKLFLYNFDLSKRLTQDNRHELETWNEKSFYLFLGSLCALTVVTTLLLLLFTVL
jgi:hypothetical protein